MSRKFEAKICWLSETQGGRKDIPLGDKYAPIIKLTKTQHKSNDFWSVFVFNKKKFISEEHRDKVIKEYSAQVIYSNKE